MNLVSSGELSIIERCPYYIGVPKERLACIFVVFLTKC